MHTCLAMAAGESRTSESSAPVPVSNSSCPLYFQPSLLAVAAAAVNGPVTRDHAEGAEEGARSFP